MKSKQMNKTINLHHKGMEVSLETFDVPMERIPLHVVRI